MYIYIRTHDYVYVYLYIYIHMCLVYAGIYKRYKQTFMNTHMPLLIGFRALPLVCSAQARSLGDPERATIEPCQKPGFRGLNLSYPKRDLQ